MHRQTLILIIILAVVTGALIFLAVSNQNVIKNRLGIVPTVTPIVKTAKVYFNPTSVNAPAGGITTADIMVDGGSNPVAGVQAEMQYDPKAITNVKITPDVDSSGFFGPDATILFNDVTPTTGRISFVIAISVNGSGKKGVGKIGTISFQKVPGAAATSSSITFLDKTLVTQLNVNESVLQNATPLTITFSNAPAVQNKTAPIVSPAR